jgi:hypothetical protein
MSITWVYAVGIVIENVRALLKGLSIRNVFLMGLMVICACGLLLNPAKVPNFQYMAWLLIMLYGSEISKWWWKNPKISTAIIRPKSRNLNIIHDGILSIKNFVLRIHSGKISALPPWKWTFGEWKAVVVRIHMLQKWNAQTFPRKAKFHTEKEAKWRNDFLINVLLQYRCH